MLYYLWRHCHQWQRVTPIIIYDPKFANTALSCVQQAIWYLQSLHLTTVDTMVILTTLGLKHFPWIWCWSNFVAFCRFVLDDCGQARRHHGNLDHRGPHAPRGDGAGQIFLHFACLLLTMVGKLGHPMVLVMAKFSLQLQSICHAHLHT